MFVIATWVTVTEPYDGCICEDVYKQMGCTSAHSCIRAVILSRAELFASKNKIAPSFDGLGMGIGFLFALVVISFFRELLGKGFMGNPDR